MKPIATSLPEEFRIVRKIPGDPLAEMPELPTNPPEFTPGKRYTQERMEKMQVNDDQFLWPEEEKLVHWLIKAQEQGFAWTEDEKGKFSEEYFEPVVIPTVEHIPWVLKNIPILKGIYNQVIEVIKDKIRAGVYEPSNSSYRSRWFCVLKKDKKALRLVHDLQPLNAISIKDSAVPPLVEPYAESFGGRACYGMFDLFVGFDQRALAVKSRDLTTFQTPLGTFRLTSIPMGYTNSMQIFHGDTTFLLREEIPHVTEPFIDDVPVKGPKTRYQNQDGSYETIPENKGIRRFVWEHLQNANRVIQRIKHAGGTLSGIKSKICTETADIVGHKCTINGRLPNDDRIQKIIDWPICKNLTEVRGFLGTLGTIRVFIKDFAMHARPLVQLTRKDVEFEFTEEHIMAMEKMKMFVQNCTAIRAIDYESDREVNLAVDSSWMGVGFILSQQGEDGKRYPSRYGSITWNETEQRYSQAKLELYGLFRALKALKMYIVGLKNLVVEVDAKYIKGMINNPDIQPSATINRWIAGILLFDFKLRHVPGKDHAPADGLSRRPKSDEDPEVEDDCEEWIDTAYSFRISCLNHEGPGPYLEDPFDKEQRNQIRKEEAYRAPPESKGSYQIKEPDRSTGSRQTQLAQNQSSLNLEDPKIPRTERAVLKDNRVDMIKGFLEDMENKPIGNDEDIKKLAKQASEFFIFEGKLWKKDRQGRHKVFIPEQRRLGLIKQAHDDLGHKGVFTVKMRLGERFWWPHMDDDIKWYNQTCHECQIRSTKKVIIPPTVSNPGGLFRKVYIDTMLMPRHIGKLHCMDAIAL